MTYLPMSRRFHILSKVLTEPDNDNIAIGGKKMKTCKNWFEDDETARYTLLNSMHDELVSVYDMQGTAVELWKTLEKDFACASVAQLRVDHAVQQLHDAQQNANLCNLHKMGQMIKDLGATGSKLTNEQQIIAVLKSLPPFWHQMEGSFNP